MALFLSRSTHKVDKKGRVSVPAAFRSALGNDIGKGIGLSRPLAGQNAIEATPMSQVEERMAQIDTMASDSLQYAAYAHLLMGAVRTVAIDSDGRMILPEDLLTEAGITDSAVFVGLGRTFQIWEQRALDAFTIEAQALVAQDKGGRLPSVASLSKGGPEQ